MTDKNYAIFTSNYEDHILRNLKLGKKDFIKTITKQATFWLSHFWVSNVFFYILFSNKIPLFNLVKKWL